MHGALKIYNTNIIIYNHHNHRVAVFLEELFSPRRDPSLDSFHWHLSWANIVHVGPRWWRRSSLSIDLPCGLDLGRQSQDVALVVHLLSCSPAHWRFDFNVINDVRHSCLLSDPGVTPVVVKCYAQHNPLHFPLCHCECIYLLCGLVPHNTIWYNKLIQYNS